MNKINTEFLKSKKFDSLEQDNFLQITKAKLPPILSEFYQGYYSLFFDGNKLFELDDRHKFLRGNIDDLELSIHNTLTFEEIKIILERESNEGPYAEHFGSFWYNYLPVIQPLGYNGYIMCGIKNENLDSIIYVNYTDDIIISVCDNIFDFLNLHLEEY